MGQNIAQINVSIGADATELDAAVESSASPFEALEAIVAAACDAMTAAFTPILDTLSVIKSEAIITSSSLATGFKTSETAILALDGSIVKIGADITAAFEPMIAELAAISTATLATAAAMDALSVKEEKVASEGKKISGAAPAIAGGLGIIAAGFALTGVAAVKAASDFQYHTATVSANAGLSIAQAQVMQQEVLKVGTATGQAFDKLEDGYMKVVSLGFKGAAAATVIEEANKSAIATGSEFAGTAEILAKVLHEYGASADQAGRYMNVLHLAAQQGNMTLEQFDAAMGPVIGVAANLGVALTDVASAESALTQHGFDAAEAATQLKSMMEHIVNPASVSTEALKKLSTSSGETTAQLQQDWKANQGAFQQMSKVTGIDLVQAFSLAGIQAHGLHGTIDMASQAVKGHLDAVMKIIPAMRGGFGAMILAGTGATDYHDRLLLLNDAMAGKIDPTSEGFKVTMGTMHQQMALLSNQIEAVLIPAGMKLIPVFEKLAPTILKVVDIVADMLMKFADSPQSVQEAVLIFGAFSAVMLSLGKTLGAAAEWFPKVIDLVKEFGPKIVSAGEAIAGFVTRIPAMLATAGEAFSAFGTGAIAVLTGLAPEIVIPIAVAIAAVTATIAVGVFAWKTNLLGFRDTVTSAWDSVKNSFNSAIANITQFTVMVGLVVKDMQKEWSEDWNEISDFVGDIWKEINDEVYAGVASINATFSVFRAYVTAAMQGVNDIINYAVAVFEKSFHDLGQSLYNMGGPLGDLYRMFVDTWNKIVGVVNDSVNKISGALSLLGKNMGIDNPLNTISDYYSDKWKQAGGIIDDMKAKALQAQVLFNMQNGAGSDQYIAPLSPVGGIMPNMDKSLDLGKDKKSKKTEAQKATDEYNRQYGEIMAEIQKLNTPSEMIAGQIVENSKAADMAAQTTVGSLKKLSDVQKASLIDKAAILDRDKVYFDLQKGFTEQAKQLNLAIGAGTNATEAQALMYRFASEGLKGLTTAEAAHVKQSRDNIIELTKQKEYYSALAPMLDRSELLTHNEHDQSMINSAGGVGLWHDIQDMGKGDEFKTYFDATQRAEQLDIIRKALQKLKDSSLDALDPLQRLAAGAYGGAEAWRKLGETTDAAGQNIGKANQAMYANVYAVETYSTSLAKLKTSIEVVTDPLTKASEQAYGGADAWKALGEATDATGKNIGESLQDAYKGIVGLNTAATTLRGLSTDAMKSLGDGSKVAQTEFEKLTLKINAALTAMQVDRSSSDLAPLISALEQAAHAQDELIANERIKNWTTELRLAGDAIIDELTPAYTEAGRAVSSWAKSHTQELTELKLQLSAMPGMYDQVVTAVNGLITANTNLQKAEANQNKLTDLILQAQKSADGLRASNPFNAWLASFDQINNVTHKLENPFDNADVATRRALKSLYDYNQEMQLSEKFVSGFGDSVITAFSAFLHPDMSGLNSLQSQLKSMTQEQHILQIEAYENRSNPTNPYGTQLKDLNKQIDSINSKINQLHKNLLQSFTSFFVQVLAGFDQTLQKMAMDYLKSQLYGFLTHAVNSLFKAPVIPGGNNTNTSSAQSAVTAAQQTAAKMLEAAGVQIKADSAASRGALQTASNSVSTASKEMSAAIEKAAAALSSASNATVAKMQPVITGFTTASNQLTGAGNILATAGQSLSAAATQLSTAASNMAVGAVPTGNNAVGGRVFAGDVRRINDGAGGEAFIPDQNGTVITAHDLKNGNALGGTTENHFHNYWNFPQGTDYASFQRNHSTTMADMKRQADRQWKRNK